MQDRATGLILRTRPLTETSLIVSWLTQDQGRISTVAKGARRPKSPFAGKLDLFYFAEFSFMPSRRSDLHTLREVRVLAHHPELRLDLAYLQPACYFVHLIEQTTEAHTPLPGLLDLVLQSLQSLIHSSNRALTLFAFEARLMAELGVGPELGEAKLTAGAQEILRHLTEAGWESLLRLRPSPAQVSELDHFFGKTIAYQFGKVARQRPRL